MPEYKLLYFDARGRAEVIRLLFAAAHVQYEDVRLTKESWPAIKPKTPGGQLPVLEVDGKMFSQSVPIMTYLATEFGFHGSTPLENLAVNEVLASAGDLKHALVMTMIEKEGTRKAERIRHLKNEDMPRILGGFETTLSTNEDGYFVGSRLTLADIAVFDTLEIPVKKVPSILAGCPLIVENMNKVRSHPGIKTWLETRPQTPF